jgi:ABC-2 type transport system permease protein
MLFKLPSPKPVQKMALKKGLLTHLENIFYLTIKELRSIYADFIVLVLIAYVFTVSVYTVATGVSTEPQNLTVGVVDEDQSNLSRQFLDVLNRPPLFKRAVLINASEIDPIMNAGRMIFVLEIPPRFEQDLVTGRQVSLQLDVDATAMAPAGNGGLYIQTIIMQEITNYLAGLQVPLPSRANVVIRARFNPEFIRLGSLQSCRSSPTSQCWR